MAASALLLAGTGHLNGLVAFGDQLISTLSKEYPLLWVAVLASLLVYSVKELMGFNKGNYDNKIKAHDSFDKNTFENAVVPLLVELNGELKGYAIGALQLTGSETVEEIIDKYEEAKRDNISQADLSTLENSFKVTDALDKMVSTKSSARTYDRAYDIARKCLVVGTATLAMNLGAGIALIVAHTGFNNALWSRIGLTAWLLFALINLVIAVIFIICKTKMDGYINEN